jgi:hypothetical protein
MPFVWSCQPERLPFLSARGIPYPELTLGLQADPISLGAEAFAAAVAIGVVSVGAVLYVNQSLQTGQSIGDIDWSQFDPFLLFRQAGNTLNMLGQLGAAVYSASAAEQAAMETSIAQANCSASPPSA